MVKKYKNKNGITLISLIITIVIMLILAAVAISLVIGKNGLFKKTNDSVTVYSAKKAEEAIELVLAEKDLDDESQNETWKDFLDSRVPDELDSVTGEGPFEVEKDGYIATVNEEGKITDIQKAGLVPEISDIKVVEDSEGKGDALAASSVVEGKTLYIVFNSSIGGGETTVDKTLPYPVTKNGNVEFNITGIVGEKTYTKKVTVKVNQFKVELKVGTYVKYNVPYTDACTNYAYNANNGWRIVNPGNKNDDGTYSNVKLVSTGIPAILNVNSDEISSSTWVADQDQVSKFREKFYGSKFDTNVNMLTTAGLYYNFKKIVFKPGTDASLINKNEGGFISINGKSTGDISMSEFLNGGATEVHDLTMDEINYARNKKAGSDLYALNQVAGDSAFTKVTTDTDGATGLFYLKNLTGFNYNSDTPCDYWLASPVANTNGSNSAGVFFLDAFGDFHNNHTYAIGVRPVVSLPDKTNLTIIEN